MVLGQGEGVWPRLGNIDGQTQTSNLLSHPITFLSAPGIDFNAGAASRSELSKYFLSDQESSDDLNCTGFIFAFFTIIFEIEIFAYIQLPCLCHRGIKVQWMGLNFSPFRQSGNSLLQGIICSPPPP